MRYILSLILCMLMVSVAYADIDVGTTLKVHAKSLPLYTTADASSKVVTNLTQDQNLIAIYKQGSWIKVANPQTGDIGWVNQNDLTNASTQPGPVVHRYVVRQKDANGKTQRYEVTEFTTGPQMMSDQDAQKFVSRMQQQQQQMQNDMNNMMGDMMRNFGDMQKMFWNNFPSIYIVHDNNNSAADSNAATNTTTQNSVPTQQQNK